MSNYTKSTNFAAKDSLPSGNANKVVKGTELNTEFDNIATAITSKADLNSPTLVTPNLGTPSVAVLTNATGLPLTAGAGVTGTLPVANGGTGASTFSSGALLKGAGTSAITTATAGTDYAAATTGTSAQLLANNGSGGFSNVTVGSGLSLSAGTLSTTGGASISAGDSNVTVSDTGSNGTVTVQTDGTERMRIDSAGMLGLGLTPSSWYTGGPKYFQLTGDIGFTATTNNSIRFNNYVNTTPADVYYGNGYAGKYTFFANSGQHVWYTAASGTAGNAITFTQVLAVEKDKSLALQGATSQSGTGITFPATQSASSDANTLDDYEEGTWTPSLGGNTTYSHQTGTYTKIGRQVTVKCRLAVSSIGTGSTRTISGLPFTPGENATTTAPYFENVSTNIVYLSFGTNSTTLDSYSATAATGTLTGAANPIFKNGTIVEFYCTYFV